MSDDKASLENKEQNIIRKKDKIKLKKKVQQPKPAPKPPGTEPDTKSL